LLLQDTVVGLMGIYSSTKTENVKATAASTLSRLLRSSPSMMAGVLERYGQHLLLTGALIEQNISNVFKCLHIVSGWLLLVIQGRWLRKRCSWL
jgi:hypothetical protein